MKKFSSLLGSIAGQHRIGCALILFVISTGFSHISAAQGAITPIAETLEFQQAQTQLNASPSGNDQPLQTPKQPLQVSITTLPSEAINQDNLATEQALTELVEPISLEEKIVPQIIRQDLQQYGYELFQNAPTTFAQVENLPVPADYRVGPGDSLIVQIYGKKNVEYRLVVTRDGRILLPQLGPLDISGMTFDEVKTSIENRYKDRVIGAQVVVSMHQLRTIQIRLTGEVNRPGAYTVSGLATLVDTLLSSGGIKLSGSLRKVQVRRSGTIVTTLDLYELLMNGSAKNDIRLSHNDVVFVPSIGDLVYIGGEVQRPAIYEIKNEKTLSDVINLAGGLLPTASIASSHIERIANRRYRTLIDFSGYGQGNIIPNIDIQAGDFVRILPVADTMDDVVLLSGHVRRPGGYQLNRNRFVSDLIAHSDQILPNTDLDFALLVREQPATKRTEVQFIDLASVFNQSNSSDNIRLQARDELRLFSLKPDRAKQLNAVIQELDLQATEYRPASTVTVNGFARYTGRFPLPQTIKLVDFLDISGGIKQGTDMTYMVIARTEFPSGLVTMTSYSLSQALYQPNSDHNPDLKPGDRIYLFDDQIDRSALMQQDLNALRAQTTYLDKELMVRANGLVAHAGLYPLEQDMRASDLVCAAGGLAETAYGLEAELSRYEIVNGEKRALEHIRLSSEELASLCQQKNINTRQLRNERVQIKRQQYGNMQQINGQTEVTDIINPIYFKSGKSQISSDDIAYLSQAINYYNTISKQVTLVVTGHTDSVKLSAKTQQTYGSNIGLSEARAARVANILTRQMQMNNIRIMTQGYGANRPVASNATESGRRQNRRVEISLILKDAADQAPSTLAADGDNTPPAEIKNQYPSHYYDNVRNPVLQPDDQLTFVKKPNWIDKASIELRGEVTRPGLYVIDRGETLCDVMKRAGGVRHDAYIFGANFTRVSVKQLQQKTLDSIQGQLDDFLMELAVSPRREDHRIYEGERDEFLRVFNQLEKMQATGRMVIDLEKVLDCDEKARVVLQDGDVLTVPTKPPMVNVAGQVYVPTSHMYRKNRNVGDYIKLSGGHTVLGRLHHAYIVQANGEVFSYSHRRSSKRILKRKVQPGASIIVPINLDRLTTSDKIKDWAGSLLNTAIVAGLLL